VIPRQLRKESEGCANESGRRGSDTGALDRNATGDGQAVGSSLGKATVKQRATILRIGVSTQVVHHFFCKRVVASIAVGGCEN
jgi:hypothetical protein